MTPPAITLPPFPLSLWGDWGSMSMRGSPLGLKLGCHGLPTCGMRPCSELGTPAAHHPASTADPLIFARLVKQSHAQLLSPTASSEKQAERAEDSRRRVARRARANWSALTGQAKTQPQNTSNPWPPKGVTAGSRAKSHTARQPGSRVCLMPHVIPTFCHVPGPLTKRRPSTRRRNSPPLGQLVDPHLSHRFFRFPLSDSRPGHPPRFPRGGEGRLPILSPPGAPFLSAFLVLCQQMSRDPYGPCPRVRGLAGFSGSTAPLSLARFVSLHNIGVPRSRRRLRDGGPP